MLKMMMMVVMSSAFLFVFSGCSINPDLAPDKYIQQPHPLPAAANDSNLQSIVFAFITGGVVGYAVKAYKG